MISPTYTSSRNLLLILCGLFAGPITQYFAIHPMQQYSKRMCTWQPNWNTVGQYIKKSKCFTILSMNIVQVVTMTVVWETEYWSWLRWWVTKMIPRTMGTLVLITPRSHNIPKACNNLQFFLNLILQSCYWKLSNITLVRNEAEVLPNLIKPNPNAQTASLYMWHNGLGGGLLISVLFLCIITAFYRQMEWKVIKISLLQPCRFEQRFTFLSVCSLKQSVIFWTNFPPNTKLWAIVNFYQLNQIWPSW